MTNTVRTTCLLFSTLIVFCFSNLAWSQFCSSADSDTDNDGWGWENAASCIVRPDTTTETQQPTGPADDCIDTDGDGWGWRQQTQQSCEVVTTTHNNTQETPQQNSGTNTQPVVNRPATPAPYPARSPFQIKALYPDFWPNRNELIDANLEGVSVNFVWAHWETTSRQTPCTENMISYANRCYQLSNAVDNEVKYWSDKGKNITAIVWGVPDWARDDHCINNLPGRSLFCSTNNAAQFADFAGMLANRYRSRSGNGLINDFVIHNEVNMFEWYNHRCGAGQTCQLQPWIDNYADNYNAAYDQIKNQNPGAKIFAPFAHQFSTQFDNLQSERPLISVQTFVRGLNRRVGNREWKIAYHPYNKGLHINGFSTDDWPHVTVGNIGVLAGWLQSEFPLQSPSWEVYLTESGYNSVSPNATQQGQADDLCRSFYNVLATPGIENYVYHRMQDHVVELQAGIGLGLHDQNGIAKPSWAVWANASGRNGNRNQLSCGFENLPYTKVSTYSHPTLASRTSSRLVNNQYSLRSTWWLMRNHVNDAVMIHECTSTTGSYLSSDSSCAGSRPLGPVGYAYRSHTNGRRSLYSCDAGNGNRFSSDNVQCDNMGSPIEFLGYSAMTR